ncbi:MAG: hypothetical protein GY939_07435 [Actinomycetia bacterium]|nr:hypothetical protein [Actinomycetes bacterium]
MTQHATRTSTCPDLQERPAAPVFELVVDYSMVGRSKRFHVTVDICQRSQLEEGSSVLLVGDSVDPVKAIVRGFCGSTEVDVEIVAMD